MKIVVMIFEARNKHNKNSRNQEQGEREQGNHSFVRERKSEDVSEERLYESARNVREAQSNVGLF